MKLRKLGSFLLALALIVGLLPGTIITAHAEETSAWTHMSPNEAELNLASYDAATDTISFTNDPGWATRMQYTGLADAAGKDWTIEFDMTTDGGAIGVYQYDASGALYGAYLDTNASRLDAVQFSDWVTQVDGFYFYGDPTPAVLGANWNGAADKLASHLRVDFVRGEGGTMAGGTVTYYKRINETDYVKIGTLKVPETHLDNADLPNIFGIHLVLGTGTVSNVTITEFTGAPAHPAWAHMSKAEQDAGLAVYDAATDTITVNTVDGGWTTRMQNMDVKAEAGKDYAIEFTMNIAGGEIGVYTYDTNANSFFGAYLDAGAGALDALHMVDGVALDDFHFREATTSGATVHPYYGTTGWDPALVNGGRIRVEFRGFSETFPGGSVTYYKQDTTTGNFLPMGVIPIPAGVLDNPNADNVFGIQLWLGTGTISDIEITELNADWVHMSTAEALVAKPTTYDAETDTITFQQNGGWADRLQYVGLPDVGGKSWTVEFDAALAGGALGIYQYEASGAMYGAYFDVTGCKLDSLVFTDWATCTDGFFFYGDAGPEAGVANWVPETDRPASHIRADFVCGANGTMAGGTVTFYKRLATGQYAKLGTINVPETIVDDPALPNFFGVHLELGTGTISNMTVTEYEPINWIHMNDGEMNKGLAVYNPAEDKITFVNDPGWANRMQYTGIADTSGEDWSVEFDIAVTGGALGIYQYEASGAMYGAYLDVTGCRLDSVVFTDWATQTDGFYFYGDTNPTVPAANWVPETDRPASHVMVKFVRGANGTMAGGTATFYKKDQTTGKYLTLGTLDVPETIVDDPTLPNIFGMHLVLGDGTVSNIAFHNCEGAEAVRENEVSGTCDVAGSYESVVYCATCGLELSRETIATEALGHVAAEAEEENRVEATCSAEGSYDLVVYCAACGEEMSRETVTIEKLDHNYGYENITDETHDKVCSVGGETVTEEHEYVEGFCACGAEEPAEDLTDAELVFATSGLSLKSYIGMQNTIADEVAAKYDRVYMVVTTEDGTEYTCEMLVAEDGTKYFEYGVAAKEMGDLLDIVLYGEKDGKTYTGVSIADWSVRAECLTRLDTYYPYYSYEAYKKVCDIVVNLMAYGAEAQKVFDYKEDSLVTDGVDAKYLALIPTEELALEAMPTLDHQGKQVTAYDISLQLNETIELFVMYSMGVTDFSDYRAVVVYNGEEYEAEIVQYPGYAGYSYIVFNDLLANDLRDDISLTVYKGETAMSATYTFSVENVAAAKKASYPELINAMMHYSDAAKAMFG